MKDFTEGNEFRLIYKFAIPLIIGLVIQQLYSVVDSIIVGKFLENGEQGLAAIGAAFPVIFFLISFVVGISNGGTIIISHFFGNKNYKGINEAIETNNIFLFVCAIIVSVIGITLAEPIFVFINLPEEVIPDAVTYMQIYSVGFMGMFGYHGVSSILRGVGDSKTPLYVLIVASVLNILLDLLFIVVLKTGIAGVAWATVIAQTSTFIAVVIYLNRTHPLIKYTFGLRFDKEIFKESVRIGLPSGFQQAFVGLGNVALMSIVSRFGTVVVAAYSVTSRIDMLCAVPAIALASAFSSFVGQNLGARKIERVERGYKITIIMGVIISVVISSFLLLFRTEIMSLFTNEQNILPYGAQYLAIVSPFYVVFTILFISNAALRGAGDTIIPMFVTLFALWIIRVPTAHFLSQHFGEVGIWWGIPMGWFIGMVFSTIYYFTGTWKRKRVGGMKNKEVILID
ncbi:MAG: MATE family efflux transporter [Bacteroidales bacterium]|jgi:putative MATE family efflux protein|nr:MATE family efflux transporter [Bacteroidales bacterium]